MDLILALSGHSLRRNNLSAFGPSQPPCPIERFSALTATKCDVNRYRYGVRRRRGGRVADLTVQFPARNGSPRVDIRQVAKQRADLLAINDPEPVAHVAAVWHTAAQAATIGIFIILFITALDLARALLLPATSAFVIGLMLGPLSARAKTYGIPSLITAIVLWLLVVVVFYGVIILLSAPALDWIAKAPEIGRIIKEKLQSSRSTVVGFTSPARRCPAARRQYPLRI